MPRPDDDVLIMWRGSFTNAQINQLHAEAFETRVVSDAEWNWVGLVDRHSLGWVTARDSEGALVGFLNVLWDGFAHAWIQDLMVAEAFRRQGIGVALVSEVRSQASAAGCKWLHVDFDDDLRPFYYRACGFTPSSAGLMTLD